MSSDILMDGLRVLVLAEWWVYLSLVLPGEARNFDVICEAAPYTLTSVKFFSIFFYKLPPQAHTEKTHRELFFSARVSTGIINQKRLTQHILQNQTILAYSLIVIINHEDESFAWKHNNLWIQKKPRFIYIHELQDNTCT